MRLDGKTAFVTGGARGIGKSVAAALCEAGSNVAVVDVDYQGGGKTASELQTLGTGVIAVSCDVTDQDQVNQMVRTIGAFRKPDVAFCNAGICTNYPAEEMTLSNGKSDRREFDWSVFDCAGRGKQMIQQGEARLSRPPPQCAAPTVRA